jgi:putative zinc finger/helix-turn-helix YgiT family protein
MNQIRLICPECNDLTPRRVEQRYEIYKVKGKPFTISAQVEVCSVCGTDVFSPALDQENVEQAYGLYRRQHGILSPGEIKAIREKYRLSQRAFSRLLGFGEITIHRYESGSLPDAAHNELLVTLRNLVNMRDFVQRHKDRLRPDELLRVEVALQEHQAETREREVRTAVPDLVFGSQEYGGQHFHFERSAHMIVFFTSHRSVGKSFRVKLLKLLWYADFLNFKRHGRSISGLSYVKLPLGPVPHEFQYLLREVERAGFVTSETRTILVENEEAEGYLYQATVPFQNNVFDSLELDTLDAVVAQLGSLSGGQLKNLSHRERAWKDTRKGAVIPYELAHSLSLD